MSASHAKHYAHKGQQLPIVYTPTEQATINQLPKQHQIELSYIVSLHHGAHVNYQTQHEKTQVYTGHRYMRRNGSIHHNFKYQHEVLLMCTKF